MEKQEYEQKKKALVNDLIKLKESQSLSSELLFLGFKTREEQILAAINDLDSKFNPKANK